MNNIPISVVIPLFNKEGEIGRALKSVFSQTRAVDEVIVVDDGSTDEGARIVNNEFGGQVQLIPQKNAGVSVARNTGIGASRNEFICLLDADDEWMPDHINEITELINDFPDAVFYATKIFYQDEKGRTMPSHTAYANDFKGEVDDFADAFSRGYGLVHSSSVCIRKSIFVKQRLVFPPGEKKGEDLFYWISLGMLGSLAFSAKPLVKVFLDAQNRSVKLKGQLPYHIHWFLSNRNLIENHAGKNGLLQFFHKNSIVTVYNLALTGDRQSIKMIIQAFRSHGNRLYLLLMPALLFPPALLHAIRSLRRKLWTIKQ